MARVYFKRRLSEIFTLAFVPAFDWSPV